MLGTKIQSLRDYLPVGETDNDDEIGVDELGLSVLPHEVLLTDLSQSRNRSETRGESIGLKDVWFDQPFHNAGDIKYLNPGSKHQIASVSSSDCVALCNYGVTEGKVLIAHIDRL